MPRGRMVNYRERLRTTKSTMGDTSNSEVVRMMVGIPNEPFAFTHIPNPVTLGGMSIHENDVSVVHDFVKAQQLGG